MTWTDERKIEFLLRLPWTLLAETTPEGDSVIRITEIPSAVGTGATRDELEKDLWEALTTALRAYLHFGDPVPVPAGTKLPWAEIEVSPGAQTADQEKTAPFAGWESPHLEELQAA